MHKKLKIKLIVVPTKVTVKRKSCYSNTPIPTHQLLDNEERLHIGHERPHSTWKFWPVAALSTSNTLPKRIIQRIRTILNQLIGAANWKSVIRGWGPNRHILTSDKLRGRVGHNLNHDWWWKVPLKQHNVPETLLVNKVTHFGLEKVLWQIMNKKIINNIAFKS